MYYQFNEMTTTDDNEDIITGDAVLLGKPTNNVLA